MSSKELHGWDILERKAKSSPNTVYLVYRVVHARGGVPRTEYLRKPGVSTRRLRQRQRPSVFRSRAGAEKAIAKVSRVAS